LSLTGRKAAFPGSDEVMAGITLDVTDEILMVRTKDDDVVAFAELYGRHADYAFGVARAICRDIGRAEEAVQDGFFSIWRSRGQYQPQRGNFKVWSMEIIRHRAIDSFRRVGSRPRLPGPGSDQESDEPDDALSPLDLAIACSERTQLLDALRGLPELQAEVIVLSFYGEFTLSEIAIRLGIPTGTVKGRMRLGLEKLRLRCADNEWKGVHN
jgi:RNA polymerase sigma-70 factor, ECF subfamily